MQFKEVQSWCHIYQILHLLPRIIILYTELVGGWYWRQLMHIQKFSDLHLLPGILKLPIFGLVILAKDGEIISWACKRVQVDFIFLVCVWIKASIPNISKKHRTWEDRIVDLNSKQFAGSNKNNTKAITRILNCIL